MDLFSDCNLFSLKHSFVRQFKHLSRTISSDDVRQLDVECVLMMTLEEKRMLSFVEMVINEYDDDDDDDDDDEYDDDDDDDDDEYDDDDDDDGGGWKIGSATHSCFAFSKLCVCN